MISQVTSSRHHEPTQTALPACTPARLARKLFVLAAAAAAGTRGAGAASDAGLLPGLQEPVAHRKILQGAGLRPRNRPVVTADPVNGISLELTAKQFTLSNNATHIIAVVTGNDKLWQRKHMLVDKAHRKNAFLEWPHLPYPAKYRLRACVDTNNNGECDENVVGKVLTNAAAQTLDMKQLTLTDAGRQGINRLGPKTDRLDSRALVTEQANTHDPKNPWYAGARNLGIIEHRVIDRSNGAKRTTSTIVGPGANAYLTIGKFMKRGGSYDIQTSTCGFAKAPCTRTQRVRDAFKDVDFSYPTVNYRRA